MGGYVSTLGAVKHGSAAEENEDAIAVSPVSAFDEWIDGSIVAAISDGASESMLAGRWAACLSRVVLGEVLADDRVVRHPRRFAGAVTRAVGEWETWMDGYLAERQTTGRPIQWYERPKLDAGACATLLASCFKNEPGSVVTWHAAALGDSCLFQIRNDQLIRAFPVTTSASFGVTPALVNSRRRERALVVPHVHVASGSCDVGDQFYLCTDALAAWFLQDVEQGQQPWRELQELSGCDDAEGFSDWVDAARREGRMRNDDVSLVHVDLG